MTLSFKLGKKCHQNVFTFKRKFYSKIVSLCEIFCSGYHVQLNIEIPTSSLIPICPKVKVMVQALELSDSAIIAQRWHTCCSPLHCSATVPVATLGIILIELCLTITQGSTCCLHSLVDQSSSSWIIKDYVILTDPSITWMARYTLINILDENPSMN